MNKDKQWTIRAEKEVFSCRITSILAQDCILPSKQLEHTFYSLKMQDWINVFTITIENTVVMVRQHRLGKNLVTLEVPAGTLEAGESPEDGIRRELAEETGYTAGELILLKSIPVNPAIQNNICHFFLATGCQKNKATNFDETEEIETEVIPLADILKTTDVSNDLIQNSVTLLSILLTKNYLLEHGALK